MNPEQQRIAIAEACGWDYHNRHPVYGKQTIKSWYYKDTNTTVNHKNKLPDYLNDLNAMHEAEKTLSRSDRHFYIDLLGTTYHDSWEFCTATAAQRAEAFLKTVGKWENNK